MTALSDQAEALARARRTIRDLRALLAEIELALQPLTGPGNDAYTNDLYRRIRRVLHGKHPPERNDS